jgi:hypothetical protein
MAVIFKYHMHVLYFLSSTYHTVDEYGIIKAIRSWLSKSSFFVIRLMVNCMNGLLNSTICKRSELMVKGDVERSANYKTNEKFQ